MTPTPSAVKREKRPTRYDAGQHKLICDALDVSSDSEAPGLTAYEAVCVTMLKLELAQNAIQIALARNKRLNGRREIERILRQLKWDKDKFTWFPCYGTDSRKPKP